MEQLSTSCMARLNWPRTLRCFTLTFWPRRLVGRCREKLKDLVKQGLAGFRVSDVLDVLCEVFDDLRVQCGFKHSKVQHSGGVFPLPETRSGLLQLDVVSEVGNREAQCLLAISRALNSYYGVSCSGFEAATAAKRSSVEGLMRYAHDVVSWEEKFDGVSWGDLLSNRLQRR